MEDSLLPPGFRFHPTDEELITYYLCQKISDSTFTSKAVVDVDLNKCEPWDLPGNICYVFFSSSFNSPVHDPKTHENSMFLDSSASRIL